MWSTLTRKYSGATRSKGKGKRRRHKRRESGQVFLEYILILAVALSMFMIVAKPFLGDISKRFQDMSKKGFFAEDPEGSNFYYYPLPR